MPVQHWERKFRFLVLFDAGLYPVHTLKKISQHSEPWVKFILITHGMKQRRHLSTLMYLLYSVNTKQPSFFIAAPTTYMNQDPNVPQGARARSAGSRPEQPVMGNGCTMCVCCVVSVSLHHRCSMCICCLSNVHSKRTKAGCNGL